MAIALFLDGRSWLGCMRGTAGLATDADGDGFVWCKDCNDSDRAVYPGAPELCDGKDNDCNRTTVENCGVSDPCGSRQGGSYVPFPAGTDRCRPGRGATGVRD